MTIRASFRLALTGLFAPAAALAQQTHLIRGVVTGDSGTVVTGATVIVTVAPSAETISTSTDSSGAFRVTIAHSTGEYLLYVDALGRRPFRRRVTISAPDTVAVVNVTLPRMVPTIAAVRVQARHPRPPATLGNDGRAGADATDRTADGVAGRLPPDLQNSFDGMASITPGLSTAGGTISAFGLGAEGNSTILNGLAFSGTDLPRDARTATRFRTSVWDPTVGGFSGVQTSVSLLPGGNVTARSGHMTLDAPPLQFADAAASRLGQRFTNIALDQGGVGAYALDHLFYNYGLHVARQMAPVASLTAGDAAALSSAGVAPDSAARLLDLVKSLGVPLSGRSIPTARTTTTVSGMERIDLAPSSPAGTAPPGPTRAVTAYGRYAQSDAMTLSPTATPAYTGRTTTGLAGFQALYSRYFGKDGDYITETTSGLSLSSSHGAPYAALPAGDVLVSSDDGLATLAFGGNSALTTDTRAWTWETINQTGFLVRGHESLPMKLYLESRFDGYHQSLATNRLGQYTYASLADLAANTPESFSRTLNAPDRAGGEWNGAAALGGSWIVNNLTLTGGARVDANVFTAAPAYNPDVDRLFGVQTSHAPNTAAVSPRLGFVWRYTPTLGWLNLQNGGGSINRGLAQIRGGVGEFRGLLQPTLLADATASTGLPGGLQQLLCLGSAVPAANWSAFGTDPSAISSACAGGAGTFADTARSVTTFDRAFQPPESWRGNLGWTNSSVFGTYVSLDATYSLTLHQPSTVNMNFGGVPQFTLADEDNRPVFVSPASIVASTGVVSPVEARRVASYGTVNDRVSDLRATARQLTATVMPNIPLGSGVVVLSYTYVDARTQTRGFDAGTGGDPRTVEWAPSAFTPRHTLIAQWGRTIPKAHLSVSTLFRVTSGIPFTPLVAGDINGDGTANDRAFVFDPAHTQDTTVANGMRTLLASGSSTARSCLLSQLGTIAPRNGCVGPWGTTMNASVSVWQIPHLDDRTQIWLYLSNITSGLDELLHGANGMRGWGVLPIPDATLDQVRGFDPTNGGRFLYTVNPRFGSTSPATTTRRSPFRVTLDVQVGLGHSSAEQRVEQDMRVRPSLVGSRASADTIKARYLKTAGTDIYAVLLRSADSLALSRGQVEQFKARQIVLRQKADSLYTLLGAYLAALPGSFDTKEAVKRVEATRDSLWTVIRAERPFVLEVLTPGQVRLMGAGQFILAALARMLTYSDDRSMFFGGGW